jgi:hypothetical protein
MCSALVYCLLKERVPCYASIMERHSSSSEEEAIILLRATTPCGRYVVGVRFVAAEWCVAHKAPAVPPHVPAVVRFRRRPGPVTTPQEDGEIVGFYTCDVDSQYLYITDDATAAFADRSHVVSLEKVIGDDVIETGRRRAIEVLSGRRD